MGYNDSIKVKLPIRNKAMSRKLLAVLVVGILVLGAVFASKSILEVQVSPFSFQEILYSNNMKYGSKYGFGVKAGYVYVFYPRRYVGVDLSYLNFKYAEKENRYLVLGLMGKIGTTIDMGEPLSFDFALKAGVDLRKWSSNAKFYPTLGLYTGLLYQINEKTGVSLGAEFKAAAQQSNNPAFNSIDLGVLGYLGVNISL